MTRAAHPRQRWWVAPVAPVVAVAAVVAAVVVLAACGGGDSGSGSGGTSPAPTRAQAATTVRREVVVRSYRELATKAGALVAATKAACAAPGDQSTLNTAQKAWRDVDNAWARTRAFRYGPTKTMRAITRIDYPVDPDKVANLLAGSDPVDTAALAKLGADRRGLGAVELVLFADRPPDARACEFAIAASTLVADAARALEADWAKYSVDADMAIEDGINGMIFALSDVGDMRLAKAAGVASGKPAPEDVDPGPARNALPAMRATVLGVDAAWSAGYRGLVTGVSNDTADRVDNQLAEVRAALEKIPEPLADGRDSKSVTDAYEAVRKTLVTLRTEAASQLGVTLQLSDADGDS